MPGDLVAFVREEYHKYKYGGFQYEMKYVLTCQPILVDKNCMQANTKLLATHAINCLQYVQTFSKVRKA